MWRVGLLEDSLVFRQTGGVLCFGFWDVYNFISAGYKWLEAWNMR